WFNNWETCLVPTSPWRSCMSIPRSLSLRRVAFNHEEPATYVLVQQPVIELNQLAAASRNLDTSAAGWPPVAVTAPDDLKDMTFQLTATLRPGTARSVGFRIRTGDDEFTEVAWDRDFTAVYVDRSQSGNVAFHPTFAGRHHAPTRLIDGEITLQMIVDRSTIEVFINGGESVISDRIFPSTHQPVIEVFAGDKTASIPSAQLQQLRSVRKQQQ
ncbi:MAG: GH32 C-terminal domain-containing protein, partial [Planctomycetaceae bacterium]|nr:GH32 C-terminal domain-containing protein [Planctomycetaceae bacterium]